MQRLLSVGLANRTSNLHQIAATQSLAIKAADRCLFDLPSSVGALCLFKRLMCVSKVKQPTLVCFHQMQQTSAVCFLIKKRLFDICFPLGYRSLPINQPIG